MSAKSFVVVAPSRKSPKIEPMNQGSTPTTLLTEDQPAFDKHCVSCHDYGQEAGKRLNLAGDLGLAHRQETWLKVVSLLAKRFLAVIYVEGNHFFYHNDFFGRIHELKAKLSLPGNVHFLENESVDIDGVLFIGATLWTDFLGKDFFKMQHARKNMNDFVVIKKPDGTRLMPEETVDLFQESKRYIFEALTSAGDRKTVVVTHHGVSPLSIHERFRGDSLNCAFMTDLLAGPSLISALLISCPDVVRRAPVPLETGRALAVF